ncbi:hypothetical protein OPT61_g9753 [Boeremia exigua]|uniref:Uncharacterized protein n=1 Tax=Boeremia exigua TaxID=749465 RepID=A0ACC2HSQ2_9PLEO|nr:hypothetical protein OPT61_g9753 [Boeremia exigua]
MTLAPLTGRKGSCATAVSRSQHYLHTTGTISTRQAMVSLNDRLWFVNTNCGRVSVGARDDKPRIDCPACDYVIWLSVKESTAPYLHRAGELIISNLPRVPSKDQRRSTHHRRRQTPPQATHGTPEWLSTAPTPRPPR